MRTGFYLRCDLIKMPLHGGGIALGHDHGRAGDTGGTDGAEYEGRLSALILGHRWPGYIVLLPNPSLIPPPDLCRRADLRARPGSAPACRGSIFLKAFKACPFWASWRGRADSLTEPIAFSVQLIAVGDTVKPNSKRFLPTRPAERQCNTQSTAGNGPCSRCSA